MVECTRCPVYSECKITDHSAVAWWKYHEGRKLPESAIPVGLEMQRRMGKVDHECPLVPIVTVTHKE